MRVLVLGGGVALLATAAYLAPGLSRANDSYAMPVAQVHQTLAAMRIPSDGDGPLGAYPAIKTDDEPDAISWAGGPRGAIACTAKLLPVSASETRIDLGCTTERPDSQAALARARIGMTEQIDATLRGRPYNHEAVALAAGAVAAIALAPARSAAEPESTPFADPGGPPPSTLPLGDDPPTAPAGSPVTINTAPVG
ncbi:MAG: hypothetical protein C0476_12175 [Sphingomonas sp.]|nr:hypothetical protein [Sphingomonas sp.]